MIIVDLAEFRWWLALADAGFLVFLLLLAFFYLRAWSKNKRRLRGKRLQPATDALQRQIALGVTASAILLPACFIIIQLGSGSEATLGTEAVTQLVVAAAYATLSMVLGVWTAGSVTPRLMERGHAVDGWMQTFAAVQIHALVFSSNALFLGLIVAE